MGTQDPLGLYAVQAFGEWFADNFMGIFINQMNGHGIPGVFLEANQTALEIAGYSKPELKQMELKELFPPGEDSEAALRQAFQRRQVQLQSKLITADGREVPVVLRAFVLSGDGGGVAISVIEDLTDRVRAEAALRDKSSELEAIFNALPDFYFRLNTEGVILDWATGRPELLYMKPEEFMGKSLSQVLPPEVAARAEVTLRQAVERHTKATAEYSVTIGDGLTHFEVRLAPLRDDQFIAVVRNITEAKESEQTLRRSEARYRAIVEDQTDLIIRFRKDGTLIFVNDALARFLDSSPKELLDKSLFDFMPGKAQAARQLLESMGPENPVVVVEPKIGKRWIQWTNRALFDADGDFVEFQAAGRDITDRKQMQDRLEMLNDCFLSLGKDPHENIAKIVMSGLDILDGTFMKYCKQDRGQCFTCSTLDPARSFTVNEDAQPCDLNLLEDARAPLVVDPDEAPCGESDLLREGIRALAINPVRLADEVVGCVCLASAEPRDFSEEDREFLAMLCKAISIEEERWAYEENLRHFIDIASHELRHPITIMKGYAIALDSLSNSMDETTRSSALQSIIRAGDRLDRLVTELLNISRIERGRFSIMKEEMKLDTLIEQAVREMRSRSTDINISLEMVDDLGVRRVDPEKINQLMVILLENAVKFSPPGSEIKVTVEADGPHVLFSVEDRGAGVPEQDRRRIFERFYQVEDPMHHSSPGIGLGLYIARKIVDAHDGVIWCEPRPGGGSVFRFAI